MMLEKRKCKTQNTKQKFKKISFIGNKAYFQSIADKNKMKMLFSKFKIIILNSKWKSEGQGKLMERRMLVTIVINSALCQGRLCTISFSPHNKPVK